MTMAAEIQTTNTATARRESRMTFLGLDVETSARYANMALVVLGAIAALLGAFAYRWNDEAQETKDAELRLFQDESRTKVANLEIEASNARTRAALAERQLLDVKNKLADRVLTREQLARITNTVRPFAGVVYQLSTFRGDRETAALSGQIENAIGPAGWALHADSQGGLLGTATGIVVIGNREGTERDRNAAEELAKALSAEGLEARSIVAGGIRIGVGVKIQVAKKP